MKVFLLILVLVLLPQTIYAEIPCVDNSEIIEELELDLELIENDIVYNKELVALPIEERPKLRCCTDFERQLEVAKGKKTILENQIQELKKTNCN